tara:strand:+ start:254 stop:523 length:270 start_codon:yes stop_codon:yes gene_type:complete
MHIAVSRYDDLGAASSSYQMLVADQIEINGSTSSYVINGAAVVSLDTGALDRDIEEGYGISILFHCSAATGDSDDFTAGINLNLEYTET